MSAVEKRDVEEAVVDERLATACTIPSTTPQSQVVIKTGDTDVEANEGSAALPESNEAPVTADPNEVDWDGPDDPQNPMNWSVTRRGVIVGMAMSIVFSTSALFLSTAGAWY
jgi:hypothetical protein